MTISKRAITLKDDFLQDAAKLLALDSPSTASYLASESVALKLSTEPCTQALTDRHRQQFCTACGNVFIPGLTCSLATSEPWLGSGMDESRRMQRRTLIYHCHRCQRHTTFRSPAPKNIKMNTKTTNPSRSTTSESDIRQQIPGDPVTMQLKSSSKKRAKARKEKAGLRSKLKK